jgi:hypothetical protein
LAIFADVSGQHVFPFSRVEQALEDANNILSRNFENNCQLMLRNIKEERRPEAHRSGNLEARSI